MGLPLGHELVHEGDEAGVVRGLQKVHQFVDDEVFKTLGRFLGEVGVEADGAGVVVATGRMRRQTRSIRSNTATQKLD